MYHERVNNPTVSVFRTKVFPKTPPVGQALKCVRKLTVLDGLPRAVMRKPARVGRHSLDNLLVIQPIVTLDISRPCGVQDLFKLPATHESTLQGQQGITAMQGEMEWGVTGTNTHTSSRQFDLGFREDTSVHQNLLPVGVSPSKKLTKGGRI